MPLNYPLYFFDFKNKKRGSASWRRAKGFLSSPDALHELQLGAVELVYNLDNVKKVLNLVHGI